MRARLALGLTGLVSLAALAAPLQGAASGSSGSADMPSVSAPRYDAAKEYRDGVAALQANDYKSALKSLKNVLSVTPRDANTNYLAALASAGLANHKQALRYAEKAVKANDGLIPAHAQVGMLRARLGDAAGAAAARAALAGKLGACTGCADEAALKKAIGDIDAAIAAGPQARVDVRPGTAFGARAGDTAYLAAVALINERRYDDAIRSLDAARTSFGAHPDILTYLGFANRKLRRYAVAEGYYRQALALAPRHRGALEYYGELKIERGDLAGARAHLALLDESCTYGCYEAEELRRWIAAGRAPRG